MLLWVFYVEALDYMIDIKSLISQSLLSDHKGYIKNLFDFVASYLDYNEIKMVVYDPFSKEAVTYSGRRGDMPKSGLKKRKVSQSAFNGLLQTRKMLVVDDMQHTLLTSDSFGLTDRDNRSLLYLPFIATEETIAVLIVAHRSPNAFSEELVTGLKAFAGVGSVLLYLILQTEFYKEKAVLLNKRMESKEKEHQDLYQMYLKIRDSHIRLSAMLSRMTDEKAKITKTKGLT